MNKQSVRDTLNYKNIMFLIKIVSDLTGIDNFWLINFFYYENLPVVKKEEFFKVYFPF